MRGGKKDSLQERLGLLRRMRLASVRVLQPLGAGANREIPIRAGLAVLVARLQGLIVESIALGVSRTRRPDQRFVRVSETAAAEIGHRIGLAPDDVVQNPEAQVLQDRAAA